MPLFEYRCDACRTRTEHLVLAGDVAATPICPSCGSHDLHRLLSTFAAQASEAGAAGDFDPATACGGGPCRRPDVCGTGSSFEDL